MKFNNYIGILLLIVFTGKLISVDAKFIEFTTENSFASHVNPNCKKIQFKNTTSTSEYFSENPDTNHTINYLCSAPYNLELLAWENLIIRNYQQKITYRAATFSSNHSKKLYPPPKV